MGGMDLAAHSGANFCDKGHYHTFLRDADMSIEKPRDFLRSSVTTADDELRAFVDRVIGQDFAVAGVTPKKFEGLQFDDAFPLRAGELAIGTDDQNAFGVNRFPRKVNPVASVAFRPRPQCGAHRQF
jgi:hypothetical protein